MAAQSTAALFCRRTFNAMHKYTQKIIFCAQDTAEIGNNLKTGDKLVQKAFKANKNKTKTDIRKD